MIYFKFKLQLKFRNNKNHSYNFKFPYRITLKITLTQNLNSRTNKNDHEKKTAQWYTVPALLFKPLKQHLIDVTSFRLKNCNVLDVF